MTRNALVRIILVTIIAIVIGGAALIVTNSRSGFVVEAPSGWLH